MRKTNSVTSPRSTRRLIYCLFRHLSRRRRIQLCMLLAVMLTSGMAELLSLGAVLPFLAVLSDPQRLWQKPLVQEFAVRFGLTSASQLLLPATLTFIAAAVLAALTRLANLRLNGLLAAAVGSDLSCEAYRRTLYQPYGVHVKHNSANVITGITIQITQTVSALNALLQLISSAVVATGLLIGLLLIDVRVALSSAVLFGSAYGVLAITARHKLQRNGKRIADASIQQLKALQVGLGAIRDVILDGSQSSYLQIYQHADRPQRQLQAKNAFLGDFPRYALEALGIAAIGLWGYALVVQRSSATAVIPLLGSLALGAQRLLPALQQIYSCWSSLKSSNAAIQSVLTMLNQPLPPKLSLAEPLPFLEVIRLQEVHFRYGPEQQMVLRGLDLEIRRGERIGLIGSTGSGKSTTVDLLMGLLEPTAGRLMVNDLDVHDTHYPKRLPAWRSAIAHVPQSIYLADTSIAQNIAFGVPRQQIDLARLRKAAEQAQISGFIEAIPEGYESYVGERGIRLSGGQRQRIGIARALYKKARVLVLDEATSALDTSTEEEVMGVIKDLSESLTVIMIAHRLSTVQCCDRVIRIEEGVVKADGPPQLVLQLNPDF